LLGLDLDAAPGTYPLVASALHAGPAPSGDTLLQVEPKQFRTRTLRVAPQFVELPPAAAIRARDEAALLEEIFSGVTPKAWVRPFGLPLRSQPTANFGSRSVFNGQPRNPHAGIDFTSPTGTRVTAPAAGTVVLARELFFTGNTVVIDHGAGVFSLLAHLSAMTVATGDVVEGGAAIGAVGATGRVTGPHLHWSVRLRGMRVDPLSLIAATTASAPA
jgi:murein DD-endopeptidase MepM/ murein hydrolase activator NlpD